MDSSPQTISVSMLPPLPPNWQERSNRQLDETGDFLTDVETRILSDLIDRSTEIGNRADSIATAMNGDMGLKAGRIEAGLRKIVKKIQTAISRTAGETYERAAQLGFPYQSMPDVRYALASGDLFGTVSGGMPEGADDTQTGTIPGTTPIDIPGGSDSSTSGGNSGTDINVPVESIPPEQQTPKEPGNIFGPGDVDCSEYICGTDASGVFWCRNRFGICIPYGNVPYACRPDATKNPMPGPDSSCYLGPPPDNSGCWQGFWTARDPCNGQLYSFENGGIPFPGWKCETKSWVAKPNCTPGGPTVPPKPGDTPAECKPFNPWCDEPQEKPCDDMAVPERAPCGPPKPVDLPEHGPAVDDVCKMLEDAANRGGIPVPKMSDIINMVAGEKSGLSIINGIIKSLIGIDDTLIPNLISRLGKWLDNAVEIGSKSLHCDRAKMAGPMAVRAMLGFIRRWFDIVPDQAWQDIRHITNYICQTEFPMPGEADVAYLRGEISEKEWECYQKAAGRFVPPAKKIMRAGRSKLDPAQLDRLFRRKFLQEKEYRDLMREAGVIEDTDRLNIHNMNEQFPSLSDTVMLMQRDVSDPNVDWKKADEVFADKYKDKVKDWFDANGISEETAKMYWRAHFHIPSFTMGQQFLFRFEKGGAPTDSGKFDQTDFEKMLIQDDWHPAFAKLMIASSYHVPTRTDLLRAYRIFAISDEQLKKGFNNLGYDDTSADFYVGYYKKLRNIQTHKAAGYPPLSTWTKMYGNCEISEDEFKQGIAPITNSDEEGQIAETSAVVSRSLWERKQAINSVRRAYIRGTMSDEEASSSLDEANIPGDCINSMLQQWERLRRRRDKTISAEKLCQMRWYGILTFEQQVVALIRTGWSREDAVLIATDCTAYISEKAAKQAAQAAQRAQAEIRRRQREIEKANRLAQCGPPDCPKSTPGGRPPVGAGPRNQGPSTNGTGPKTPKDQ